MKKVILSGMLFVLLNFGLSYADEAENHPLTNRLKTPAGFSPTYLRDADLRAKMHANKMNSSLEWNFKLSQEKASHQHRRASGDSSQGDRKNLAASQAQVKNRAAPVEVNREALPPTVESKETLPPAGEDYYFVGTTTKGSINGEPNVKLVYYNWIKDEIILRALDKPVKDARPIPQELLSRPKVSELLPPAPAPAPPQEEAKAAPPALEEVKVKEAPLPKGEDREILPFEKEEYNRSQPAGKDFYFLSNKIRIEGGIYTLYFNPREEKIVLQSWEGRLDRSLLGASPLREEWLFNPDMTRSLRRLIQEEAQLKPDLARESFYYDVRVIASNYGDARPVYVHYNWLNDEIEYRLEEIKGASPTTNRVYAVPRVSEWLKKHEKQPRREEERASLLSQLDSKLKAVFRDHPYVAEIAVAAHLAFDLAIDAFVLKNLYKTHPAVAAIAIAIDLAQDLATDFPLLSHYR